MQTTILKFLYLCISLLIWPFLYLKLRWGYNRASRIRQERTGLATQIRPAGPLIWCHGASVGEVMSSLPILRLLQEKHPEATILITSSSKTSIGALQKQLPPGFLHQYLPFDFRKYTNRFLRCWKPDLVLWIEADYWPNMLIATSKKAPIVLLNGRLSEKSFARWKFFPPLIKVVINKFSYIFPQTKADGERLKEVGGKDIIYAGNIKYFADPLPFNNEMVRALNQQISKRPFWLAASTHPGEEEIILTVHAQLKKHYPKLLTVIVPRHPRRAPAIRELITAQGLTATQRSVGESLKPQTDIYLADTMGELGLFYHLAPFTFLGGSLVPIGGHTPIEPALMDCGVISGPHTHNNAGIFHEFDQVQALLRVNDKNDLYLTVNRLLQDQKPMHIEKQNAINLIQQHQGAKNVILNKIEPLLKKGTSSNAAS